jgi:hypothetical protein
VKRNWSILWERGVELGRAHLVGHHAADNAARIDVAEAAKVVGIILLAAGVVAELAAEVQVVHAVDGDRDAARIDLHPLAEGGGDEGNGLDVELVGALIFRRHHRPAAEHDLPFRELLADEGEAVDGGGDGFLFSLDVGTEGRAGRDKRHDKMQADEGHLAMSHSLARRRF